MAIASQKSIPEIDLEIHKNIETATLCLGCFWGPDAEFGAMEGVLRTRVGYSGGELENPSYHNIGDHIETLQIDFDPEIISFREIAEIFWNSHNPFEPYWSRQYTKAIFYHNLGQKETIELLINDIELFLDSKISTEIKKFDKFYIAENYHQKYHLPILFQVL